MRKIEKSFCHLNLETERKSGMIKDWAKPFSHDEILKSPPMKVNTYDELVGLVARILHYNREFVIYYRGQGKDYKNKAGHTLIPPSIFRENQNGKPRKMQKRFEVLEKKSEQLVELFRKASIKFAGTRMVNSYREIAWALLQHYEKCDTPLVDLTHSIHVACSFAFDRNTGSTGIVYVLGMPWQSDAIGYNSFEELVNLRLLNVCPPSAQRPFFQEGYLAGPFPNYKLDDPNRSNQFDFNRRLIAKFEIPIIEDFWGAGFQRIPREKLYQENDKILKLLEPIEKEFLR
ncbi:FRG domain-containing protein [Cognataquiflexum rubidum]|uniref:FRG domain-containing protein n=1 Tax=Cognataquiflexum rubidum TaxID=2922273 RepID=UPI001F13288B|nr:FRG domain-containing protein [Cognataquiflexum rubidum]MCH6236665.1 FRG domain-containing protein [Cognataquiflexum rubidum]